MVSKISRRDFLKVGASASLVPLAGRLTSILDGPLSQNSSKPNIIIILFDALSAKNLSLYGYPRLTSPTFEHIAQRSYVYHAHRSAGNFTAPSTASLFTGTYPWTHRVFSLSGIVNPAVRSANILELLPDDYYKVALVQNMYADMLLYQFKERIDTHLGPDTAGTVGKTIYDKVFPNDPIYGAKTYDQFLFSSKDKPGSLFLSLPVDAMRNLGLGIVAKQLEETYPEGVPRLPASQTYFTIDGVMDSAWEMLASTPSPFFAYLHFMPPHTPYRPSSSFLGSFDDGWGPEPKKNHRLSDRRSPEHLDRLRQKYDEFIANMDAELGKLLARFEKSGLLENTYLIVTSDHGEFFERGEQGHVSALLFDPGIQVPLLISTPGQRDRRDINIHTSNVDIMPTVLDITGVSIPETCEGRVLPGLGGTEDSNRSIYAMEAKKNPSYMNMKKHTTTLIRGSQKLVYYKGYKNYNDKYEFYDLEADPEEIHNQYPDHPASQELQDELDQKLHDVDLPYSAGA